MKADFQMPEREERLQGPDLVRLDIPDGIDDFQQITNNKQKPNNNEKDPCYYLTPDLCKYGSYN